MESRLYFVKQVVDTIRENHGQHGDSFIFGLSGKWGEGKTHFLKQLKKELLEKDPTFKVYQVNPWKFSNDKVSFLRNFLKTLYPENKQDELQFLHTDTSQTRVQWGLLCVLLFVLAIFFAAYLFVKIKYFPNWPEKLRTSLTNGKPLWTIILLPILLSFISKIFTIQKSNHALSTVDQFDTLLTKILKEIKDDEVKPIVFVDDLDRVTPGMARSVLDNLRTFFDRKDLTFIVAGDHTVLERYLGKDLLPDAKLPEQLEEGRRFMKKIFNVYWRLPVPIQQEIEKFLDEEFQKRNTDLTEIFPQESDRKILRSYLSLYFDKNFRQIIRFFELVLFTFQVIKQKSESDSETEKRYFEELTAHPMLVVRILMIQELCAPLFEKILRDYQILSDLEYAVEKKDSEKMISILSLFSNELSISQQDFIKRFLYEEPRFFKASSLIVSDIQPFLFLAADASFGDSRGPSKEDFMTILRTGDPDQVKNSLLSMGEQRAKEAAQTFAGEFASLLPGDTYKTNFINTILVALQKLPPEYSVHSIFGEALKSQDYSFINTYPDPEKLELLKKFWSWLDLLDKDLAASYVDKFPYTNIITFNNWLDLAKIGPFSTRMVARWLKTYYQQNKEDAINRMLDTFSSINWAEDEVLKEEMQEIQAVLINDMMNDASVYRDSRLELLKAYTEKGIHNLREVVLAKVSELNGDIFQWGKNKAGNDLWKLKDLEDKIFDKLSQSSDYSSLNQALAFITSNNVSDTNRLWSELTDQQMDILVENLPSVIGSPYSYTPNSKKGLQLLNKVISKIVQLSDESQKIQWLDYIRKDRWLWLNVKSLSEKKLAAFTQSQNELLRNKVAEVLSTWKTPQ